MKRFSYALLVPLSAALLAAGPAAKPESAEKSAARQITDDLIRGHVRFLSSDLLEGRGPATRGDRLAQEYIAGQLEAMGIEPAAPGGGWLQKVELVGITGEVPQTISVRSGSRKIELARSEDFVVFSGVQEPESSVRTRRSFSPGSG